MVAHSLSRYQNNCQKTLPELRRTDLKECLQSQTYQIPIGLRSRLLYVSIGSSARLISDLFADFVKVVSIFELKDLPLAKSCTWL